MPFGLLIGMSSAARVRHVLPMFWSSWERKLGSGGSGWRRIDVAGTGGNLWEEQSAQGGDKGISKMNSHRKISAEFRGSVVFRRSDWLGDIVRLYMCVRGWAGIFNRADRARRKCCSLFFSQVVGCLPDIRFLSEVKILRLY